MNITKNMSDRQKLAIIVLVVAALIALTAIVIATEDVSAQQRTTRYVRPAAAATASAKRAQQYVRPTASYQRTTGQIRLATVTPATSTSTNTASRSGR